MLTFLHPAFLWLAPLALVPVILHLLSRIAPQSLRFPATRFLHNSPMPMHGRRRWQDILLMIVRTALIAIIILLLASPFWQNPANTIPNDKKGCVAILDSSPSMCACINELRDEAKSLPQDTCFLNSSNQQISPEEWMPLNSAQTPTQALQSAAKYLYEFPAGARTLHIFSDLQNSTWSGELPSMPEDTNVIIHTNTTKVSSNWSITAIHTKPLGNSQLRILATCQNWSSEANTRTLLLKMDAQTYQQEISLAPNSAAAASFIVDIPIDSRACVSFEQNDGFPFDDKREFWARPEPPHPVLTVFPGDDEKLSEELEFFVIPALTSEPDYAPLQYTANMMDITGLQYAELASQAAIFLLGAADRLDEESASLLRNYVADGGVLFSVPGASPLVGWRLLQKTGLAPRGVTTLEKHPTGIGALKTSSALSGLFPEKHPSDLHLFRIKKHLKISQPDLLWTSMLDTMEGTPALLHNNLGKGQIFLFTFGFDSNSSDFPITKSFLPLLRELLNQAIGNRSEIISIFCGEKIPELKSLDGSLLKNPPDTSLPGLTTWENRLLEINIPPQESSVVYRDSEEITRALAGISDEKQVSEDENAIPLTAMCAYALVALILLETLLVLQKKTILQKTPHANKK